MNQLSKFLVSIDSKGKLRQIEVEAHWDDSEHAFAINRITGCFGGKLTEQPVILVSKGKAGRTVSEQAALQFNHIIKEYKDKGYKEIPKNPDTYSESELKNIVGNTVTNQDGILKPMLAKQADKVANQKIYDKVWYASRKVNGVRCLIYKNKSGIHTCSRGATNYDLAINHIIYHPLIEEFFNRHPNVIMDGEIYKHDPKYTLNVISGICRTQKTVDDGKDLEFYWYDLVDLKLPFKDRYKQIIEYSKELNLTEFDPYRTLNNEILHIQLLPHEKISGWNNMKNLHDKYVSEGWEGLVIRQEDSLYKPGSRGNDWIKIKVYQDAEYPIVGISEGLREEDMCFILETPNGQQFNCKPMGDRLQKEWYREHIEELKGKLLTIKYFEMSGVEGSEIPQQPIGICIRDYE